MQVLRTKIWTLALLVATSVCAVPWPALAAESGGSNPTQRCYEVIPARPNLDPPLSMLVDRCRGRTWLLTRTDRGDYYWSPIPVEYEASRIGNRDRPDLQ